MSEAPATKNLPVWKVATIVVPAALIEGSTSVACWLVALLKGSVLTSVTLNNEGGGNVAAGGGGLLTTAFPPQAAATTAAVAQMSRTMVLKRTGIGFVNSFNDGHQAL